MKPTIEDWPQEIVEELKKISRHICRLVPKSGLGLDGKFYVLSKRIKWGVWRAELHAKTLDRFQPQGDTAGTLTMEILVTKTTSPRNLNTVDWRDKQQVWRAVAVHDDAVGDGMTKFIVLETYQQSAAVSHGFY
ncbi:MAG: hypothetical protein ACNA7J_14065 [Wenzhouxiangella sp.]